MLNEIPGVNAIVPQGAFYCYPNFSSLLGRPLGPHGTVSGNTLELADAILGEAKVAFVPGEAFGTPGYALVSASRWPTPTWKKASAASSSGCVPTRRAPNVGSVTSSPAFDFDSVSLDWLRAKPGAKWHRTPDAIAAVGGRHGLRSAAGGRVGVAVGRGRWRSRLPGLAAHHRWLAGHRRVRRTLRRRVTDGASTRPTRWS